MTHYPLTTRQSDTNQIRCLPFGIAWTAVTDPEFPGNRNVREGGLVSLCSEYSSTVPLRRPAYMKSPFVDQQALISAWKRCKNSTLIHHGGVPLGAAASRDTIRSCRRSHKDIAPSKLLVRNTSLQGSCSEDGPSGRGS